MRELVTDILDGATSPGNWDCILDKFNSEFDVSASCMFSVHEFSEASVDFRWSKLLRENVTQDVLDTMKSGGDADDRPGYMFLLEKPAQTFYAEPEMFEVESSADLPPSKIRDIVRGYGFSMRTSAVINKTGPWMDGLFCQHQSTPEWQSFLSDVRTDFVMPIVASSVSLGRTLQALRSHYQASLSVLDALGLAVFLVDITGNVIERNKEAQRILDLDDGLTLTASKQLKLRSPDKTNELKAMVESTNGLLRGELKSGSDVLASDRQSGSYDFLISVRALSDSQAELEPGLKCAFVTVIDPERKNALSAEGVSALGQLSQAESKVVELLINGLRPADVAEQRDVSINTIKKQLQIVSQKLRCRTQSDIIRVAAATRIPIDKN